MSSNEYRHSQAIAYVADLVGGDVAADLLKIRVEEMDTPVDIADREARDLGKVDVAGADSTLPVQEDTPLDVSGATVPVSHQGVIDVSSRDGRNLGDVDVTELPDVDAVEWDGFTLSASTTAELRLAAIGGEKLQGVVVSTGSYDVDIAWETSGGTVITTTSVASGVAGGTATQIDEIVQSPYATVQVTDTSAADQTLDGVAELA